MKDFLVLCMPLEIGVKAVARLPLAETVALRCRSRIFKADLALAEVTASVSFVPVAFMVTVGPITSEGARGARHC